MNEVAAFCQAAFIVGEELNRSRPGRDFTPSMAFPGMFHLLTKIAEEPLAMNEIAAEVRCAAANATGVVDRIEEQGYVIRFIGEDRRVILVGITEDGSNLLARHSAKMEEIST